MLELLERIQSLEQFCAEYIKKKHKKLGGGSAVFIPSTWEAEGA